MTERLTDEQLIGYIRALRDQIDSLMAQHEAYKEVYELRQKFKDEPIEDKVKKK